MHGEQVLAALRDLHRVRLADDRDDWRETGELLDELLVDLLDAVGRDEVEHAMNAHVGSVAILKADVGIVRPFGKKRQLNSVPSQSSGYRWFQTKSGVHSPGTL